MIVTRGLFGAGEAGAFPNLTRMLTTWLPVKERERAQAIVWLSTRVAGAFTPLLVVSLIELVSWRRTFEIFGAIGVIWAVLFYRWYRDDPATHPAVNQAEARAAPAGARHRRRQIRSALASDLLAAVRVAAVAAVHVSRVRLVLLHQLAADVPRSARGTSFRMGAILAGLPLLLGGLGCLVSAAAIPRLARRFGGIAIARRIIAITGFVGASICIVIFTGIADPVTGDVRARARRILQ